MQKEAVESLAKRSLWDGFAHVESRCETIPQPHTWQQWQKQAAALRGHIQDILGVSPSMAKTPEVQMLGVTSFGDYRVERLSVLSRANFMITANLYSPLGAAKPCPAILCPHGHSGQEGKAAAMYQALYVGLARRGFVVLAPDAVGLGERWEQGHKGVASPFLLSGSLTGMELWDNMKCLDVLCQRDDVDATRLGCMGNSGGGTQTAWLAALDERVKAAVVSDATTSLRYNHAKERDICTCNLAPRLLPILEMEHLLGLIAPRALLLLGGTFDNMFPWDLQRRVYRLTRRFYALCAAEDQISQFMTAEAHSLTQEKREAAYAFFLAHLQDRHDAELSVEAPFAPLSADDPALLCYEERPAALQCSVDDVIRQEAVSLLAAWPKKPKTAFRDERRKRLRELLLRPTALPAPQQGQVDTALQAGPGSTAAVIWSDAFTPILATAVSPRGSVDSFCLIIDEAGRHSPWSQSRLNAASANRRLAVAIDVRGWGTARSAELSEDGSLDEWVAVQKGLGYDVPLLGLRVQDVLAVISWLRASAGADLPLAVQGRGLGAILALITAVLNEAVTDIFLEDLPISFIPAVPQKRREFFSLSVPELISAVGDVAHLLGLLAPRRCVVGSWQPQTHSLLSAAEHCAPARACYEAMGVPAALQIKGYE